MTGVTGLLPCSHIKSDKIFPVETECRFVFWFKVSADLLNTNGDDLEKTLDIHFEFPDTHHLRSKMCIRVEYIQFQKGHLRSYLKDQHLL
jgi:hypothetical protein